PFESNSGVRAQLRPRRIASLPDRSQTRRIQARWNGTESSRGFGKNFHRGTVPRAGPPGLPNARSQAGPSLPFSRAWVGELLCPRNVDLAAARRSLTTCRGYGPVLPGPLARFRA